MFWNIVRLESTKTFQRFLFWGSLLILAVFLILSSVIFFSFQGTLPRWLLVWPGSLIYGLNNAIGFTSWSSYGTYVLIILTGVTMTQEYSWRTLQQWIGHGVSRTLFLSVRFLITLFCALAIVCACLLAVGGATLLFSLISTGSVNVKTLDVFQLFLAFLRTTYSMLPYAALTMFLAVASRSTAVAVGGGLAFIAIGETIINTLLPVLGRPFAFAAQFLPVNLAINFNSANYALAHVAATPGQFQINPLVTFLGITLYILLFGIISLLIFRRQDLAH